MFLKARPIEMLSLFNFVAARWGMGLAYRLMGFIPWATLVLGLLIGASASWVVGRSPLKVELADVQRQHAEAMRLTIEQAALRLRRALEHGDQLTHQLAQYETQIQQLSREKDDAIRQATTGRTCLDSNALRVLHGAPGLRVDRAELLPTAPSRATSTDGPVAPYASDLDIGRWSIAVGTYYETCRSRLQALIDWHLYNNR